MSDQQQGTPSYLESVTSQIPALQLLINLGWKYLTPDECLKLRGGRESNVILDDILTDQLRKINRIEFKGKEYPFTEGNILAGAQALKDFMYDGLIRTNEQIYDLICLGKSLPQSIEGDIKSHTLRYIDWENPKNNAYHCTAEFSVERTGSYETRRPDIVLFVNGIPFVVIECKSPKEKDPVKQGISQHIRNQKDDEIPGLYIYSQLLLSLGMDEAKYATTGTRLDFWAVWKENLDKETQDRLSELVNEPVDKETHKRLLGAPFWKVRHKVEQILAAGSRLTTEQDRLIYFLCRPERLLELTYRYLMYDFGTKKIARYQQYFCVQKIVKRVQDLDNEHRRKGGVVWHTQGSGKSLTMVMLAKALALDLGHVNPRIILVTDRVDLDQQIYDTFRHCGLEPVRADSGRHLADLIKNGKSSIIATVIDKFETAVNLRNVVIDDPNIFVLVDESHRTQYGPRHAKMRKVLPKACFIGFTGTPVAKKNKNTIQKFGGLIDAYPITEAVKDKAVVPLLYEGRHVPQNVEAATIDGWFDKLTVDLTDKQKSDLKKKFATKDQLNKAEMKVQMAAWDIGKHFDANWKGTPFKAQLVAPDKATALLYKKFLDEFGKVRSEVLISGPDDREGETDIHAENKKEVVRFWKEMMKRFGSESEYNKQLIAAFKHGDDPEIIIVVDKLLTGFDAPRNTVLYLTRKMEEHNLLQAIARVNRLHKGKDFGFILDYRGVLESLDHALDLYSTFSEFDKEDLEGTWTNIDEVIAELPQRHSELWDVFKGVKNKQDVEAFERFLEDEERRNKFYEKFAVFARTLGIALSSDKWMTNTPEKEQRRYNADLKFFKNLRYAVRRRYADTIEFSEYEEKIQKLINQHVGAGEVEQITGLVDIFNKEAFEKEVEKAGGEGAKADTIAHRLKKTMTDRWNEDPEFYKKFSKMLQDVIDEFRAERIKAREYLKRVKEIMESVRNRTGDELPEALEGHDVAKAFYGVVERALDGKSGDGFDPVRVGAETAVKIEEALENQRIVNWINNADRKNLMRQDIEDILYELRDEHGVGLDYDTIDDIMEQCLDIYKVRRP